MLWIENKQKKQRMVYVFWKNILTVELIFVLVKKKFTASYIYYFVQLALEL